MAYATKKTVELEKERKALKKKLTIIQSKMCKDDMPLIDELLTRLNLQCSVDFLVQLCSNYSSVKSVVKVYLDYIGKGRYEHEKNVANYYKKQFKETFGCTSRDRTVFGTIKVKDVVPRQKENAKARVAYEADKRLCCFVCCSEVVDGYQILPVCNTPSCFLGDINDNTVDVIADSKRAKAYIEELMSYHKTLGFWQALLIVRKAYRQMLRIRKYYPSDYKRSQLSGLTVETIEKLEKEVAGNE